MENPTDSVKFMPTVDTGAADQPKDSDIVAGREIKTNLDPTLKVPKKPSDLEVMIQFVTPMVGRWETVLSRSDSMSPILKHMKVSLFKRLILERCSTPFTVNIKNGLILDFLMHLPIGERHMLWRLDGEVCDENDPDCGIWSGRLQLVEHVVEAKKHLGPIPMVQQYRWKNGIGTIKETRGILPDDAYGRILYLHYEMKLENDPHNPLFAVRTLRPV